MHRFRGDSADIDRLAPRVVSRDDAHFASPDSQIGCQQSNDGVIGLILNWGCGYPDLDAAVVDADDSACACSRGHQDMEAATAGPLLDWVGGSVSFDHRTLMLLPGDRERFE